MNKSRIVSFLPAATEMIYALGAADRLVGVSHECDFPPAARNKPIVVRPALPLEKMGLRQIDEAVSERLRNGESLYQIDEKLLAALQPDCIVTQNLCQVCAPSGNELSAAIRALRPVPEVLYLTPRSLNEVLQNLQDVGRMIGCEDEARRMVGEARERLRKISERARKNKPVRVFFMEWADPIYCGGHWVPEMIEIAGGVDELARKGKDSVRTAWEEVVKSQPEVLILSPCGFNAEGARAQVSFLHGLPDWKALPAVRANRVYAVDANAYFARPGPRVVGGTQLLAHLFHPELFEWSGPTSAFHHIETA
jgi:iron complex transport system substrate-binding protein